MMGSVMGKRQNRNWLRQSALCFSLLCLFAAMASWPLFAQTAASLTHTVRTGETLSEIAASYGVATADLMALNGISNPNQIRVGEALILPANAVQIGGALPEIPTHTVAAAETLSQIAQLYGVSMTRLMFLNGLSDADEIYEGQVLRLPIEVVQTETPTTTITPSDDEPDDEPPLEEETPEVTPSPEATPTLTVTAEATVDETPLPEDTLLPGKTPEATSAAEATAEEPTSTPSDLPEYHEVQPGETLSEIAQQYGLSMRELMAANGIVNPDAIYSGQRLRLPSAATRTPTPTATSDITTTPTATVTIAASATPTSTAPLEAEEELDTETEQPDAVETGPAQPVSITSLNRTYEVRQNDTINRIALRLGVDAEALRRINRLEYSTRLVTGERLIVPATAEDIFVARSSPSSGQTYVVQSGDSLSQIAKDHELSLSTLMAANYIGNPDTIRVGQELIIPSADEEIETVQEAPRVGPERSGYYYYTVQTGDTLMALAEQFDSTMLALLDYNGLPNLETVYRGLELRIPYGPPPLPVRQPPSPASGSSFLVSLSRQECWLFWGKEVQRRWRCSTGYGEFVTRTGSFAVQSKIENAKSNAYQLDMPYWLGIYDVGNYENGIHGLPISWETGEKIWTSLIGQPATFGCAMLADEDAAELFAIAYIGMPVHIID